MISNLNKFIYIYECCRIILGSKNSIICDFQRGEIVQLPYEFSKLLLDVNRHKLSEVKKKVLSDFPIFIENLEILERKGFLTLVTDISEYPKISLQQDNPHKISNCIIQVSNYITKNPVIIFKYLEEIDCENIQLINFDSKYNNQIIKFLNLVGSYRIRSIEILTRCSSDKEHQSFIQLLENNPRIFSVIFHSSDTTEILYRIQQENRIIAKINLSIQSSKSCGNISNSLFNLNIKSFTESQHHNTCLNRKISIDVNGDIKNCPSMPKSYGNIKDTTLQEALEHPDFKKYWNIKKDEITKCKDCEFRHICTDCRAYRDDPEDIYSAPLKCGYDPYTGKWEEWSTNPLKQKAIDFYEMREIL